MSASGEVRVSVLGATGSVGRSTLDVVARPLTADRHFRVAALTAHRDVEGLAAAALETSAEFAVIADPSLYGELKGRLQGSGVEAAAGPDALVEAAQRPADCVVAAIVGVAGLRPTLAAVRTGCRVAIANKESLVCAGRLMIDAARASGAVLLPIDSEHNAIFQVLQQKARVSQLILTASGGPFRDTPLDQMRAATVEQACDHPNWKMGPKISIDSATMMNKGLELIEAAYLFDTSEDRIDIVIHPQSIVHSLVAYDDGSVLAQLGMPDMRTPISYALAYPHRMALPGVARLDLARLGQLDFSVPDPARFPAIGQSRAACAAGGKACIALNAANEEAVAAFRDKRIGLLGITEVTGAVLEDTLRASGGGEPDSFDHMFELDAAARRGALRCISRLN
ncbi:1-deoxy-D-xylulose-5-phosphate reductoisomerase [bacterium]|nr:1-deoxy-D-xylulose-5-phosphate reductoisomerase [bacterium]